MGISWISDLSSASRSEWDSILARTARPQPFLSPAFLVPWARRFSSPGSVRVARFDRDGEARGFLFLHASDAGGGWSLLGGEQVADELDALVARGAESEFWDAVIPSLSGLPEAGDVVLQNLVEGSPTLALLPGICLRHGRTCRIEETDRSPYVALPGSFADYVEELGKKQRHELRRKIRRANEAIPEMAFRRTESLSELPGDVASFVDLLRKSHPEKMSFMDERMTAFFADVAQGFFARGELRLAFLSGAGGDVAAVFQIESGGCLRLYNSGHDPAWRFANPGLVLLARCIEDAIGRGLREYDFLRGTERYKYDLGGRDRVVWRATIGRP